MNYYLLHTCFVVAMLTAQLVLPLSGRSETLETAWEQAILSNHTLSAARKASLSAGEQLAAAKAARLPKLSLQAAYRALDNEPGILIMGMDAPMSEDRFYRYGAEVEVPLFTSWQISHGIDAARFGEKAAEANETRTSHDLKLYVANAYVGVLRSLEGVAVVQSHVKSLASHTKTVHDMLDQGFVASNDLLASNVALANARQLALQARNRLDIACAAYNRLLCRPLDRKVSLEKLTLSPPAQALEILTARALKQRSELRLLSMNISALQHKAAMEKAVYGPQIGITGGYGYEENRYMAHEGIWSAQIGLKWSFDGGIAWHRSASIKQEAEALQENHSDVKTIIALETRRAWLTLGESRERVKVTHKALAQGEENLKVTEDQYKQGLTTNTTVLEAESLRTRSHSNYVNASYDVEMAILRLRHAIGEM